MNWTPLLQLSLTMGHTRPSVSLYQGKSSLIHITISITVINFNTSFGPFYEVHMIPQLQDAGWSASGGGSEMLPSRDLCPDLAMA